MAGLGLSLSASDPVPWVDVGLHRPAYDAAAALCPEQVLGDPPAITYPRGSVYGI